ncbi:CapA family protein [Bacillus sp. Marseille-Q3570]|uniref:CapA family protein n=1 Tax=Bacillus sp. Marseille-Q3570 TaxID=2963522 RepID=UPI0021B80558|nr:CapA family protein [Bacillus sp. Marseille-Q3570]
MKKVTVISLFVVSFALLFMFFLNSEFFLKAETEAPSRAEQQTETAEQNVPEPEPEEITTTASLMAVGDILIHDYVYNQAKTSEGRYDFTAMFKLVKPYLESADITIANQETMIGGSEIGVSTYPRFNSPFEIGTTLKESGVDLVTIANNHTLDRGEDAILNALDHWDEIGMEYTGSYRSEEDRTNLRLIERNDITFSFLSYTYGTNGIPVPESKPHLVNLIDIDLIKSEIEEAKRISDVVVLSLHFGNEYERLPNEQQKLLANEAAAAGADIIIGHHPHVLQPAAWIDNPDGSRTFVTYSLGNFLSGQRRDYKDIGGIVQINVKKVMKGDEVEISLEEPAFLPTWVDRQYTIQPMFQLLDHQQTYKEIKQHMSQWIPDMKFIER